jgi:hypothetical protein
VTRRNIETQLLFDLKNTVLRILLEAKRTTLPGERQASMHLIHFKTVDLENEVLGINFTCILSFYVHRTVIYF